MDDLRGQALRDALTGEGNATREAAGDPARQTMSRVAQHAPGNQPQEGDSGVDAGEATAQPAGETTGGLDVILHIPVTVQVVLGRAKMSISRLMTLGPGAVVPLDRKAGEPVEVVVNGRLVARGEVVLLDDGVRFGISLTEIVEPGARTC